MYIDNQCNVNKTFCIDLDLKYFRSRFVTSNDDFVFNFNTSFVNVTTISR